MEKLNQAQNLLEKLNALSKDEVTISIEGVDFTFVRDVAAYDVMINDITMENKVTPTKDYLLTIVKREQRDDLLKIINVPGLALSLAGKVNEVLIPKIEMNLKNL